MPRRISRARTRRTRRRKRLTTSLDYHKFKLRLVKTLETDPGGQMRALIQCYSLSNVIDVNVSGTFDGLQEVGNLTSLFDSYRVKSVQLKWLPFFNVQAPDGITPPASVLPPFYIRYDPDDTGLEALDPNVFITHKNFIMKPTHKSWTHTFYPQRKVGVSPASAISKGYMNCQSNGNESNGNILMYQLNAGALPNSTPIGTLMITYIVEFKNRQ